MPDELGLRARDVELGAAPGVEPGAGETQRLALVDDRVARHREAQLQAAQLEVVARHFRGDDGLRRVHAGLGGIELRRRRLARAPVAAEEVELPAGREAGVVEARRALAARRAGQQVLGRERAARVGGDADARQQLGACALQASPAIPAGAPGRSARRRWRRAPRSISAVSSASPKPRQNAAMSAAGRIRRGGGRVDEAGIERRLGLAIVGTDRAGAGEERRREREPEPCAARRAPSGAHPIHPRLRSVAARPAPAAPSCVAARFRRRLRRERNST